MASSPVLSPASTSRRGSPELLTPRSKIKALLATVQSSDEEDGSPTKTSYRIRKSFPSVEDDDSDGSGFVARPRGKLASRMRGDDTTKTHGTDTRKAPEGAIERVGNRLGDGQADSNEDGASNNGDEDDDLPVAPRRLKRRLQEDRLSIEPAQKSRSPSPGLFISSPMRPSPAKSNAERASSDDDLPAFKSERFKALVERKRQERLAREAEEEARRAEKYAQQEKLASELEQLLSEDESGGITDDEGGRRLTQGGRPARKASKKAVEEMNRETQRMARSMQLAPEAKTKKKISKASLLERFNFKPAGDVPNQLPPANSSSRPTTPQSDAQMDGGDTPPSSPPSGRKIKDADVQATEATRSVQRGSTSGIPEVVEVAAKAQNTKRRLRVKFPSTTTNAVIVNPDDELEITMTAKGRLDALFENLPATNSGESKALKALRALAQVQSPEKDKTQQHGKSSMTPGELQVYLRTKAREQAKLERERRLKTLRDKGVVIQTAEEREKQELEVEDLVTKARLEAQRIMEEERDEAKRLNKADGKHDPLAWDDSEDEEYEDAADEADAEAELSGSEEEDAGSADEDEDGDVEEQEEEEDEDEEAEGKSENIFDEVAHSVASDGEDLDDHDNESEDEGILQTISRHRKARHMPAVLSDDEDGIEATPRPARVASIDATPLSARTASPAAPSSVLRSAKKTFIPGLPVAGPAGLGLTQIFTGTMDSQKDDDVPRDAPTQLMPDFEHFPDSNFSATADEPVEDVIMDSQKEETQAVQLNLSQSQMHGLGSLVDQMLQSQATDIMDFTQDVGFQPHSPLLERYIEAPASTVDTLIVDAQDGEEMPVQESPLVRRGRLRRKLDMSVDEPIVPASYEASPVATEDNAFETMKDAAQREKRLRLAEDFNRKKSKAKGMVEEQAEESEDEYAGLGGADGEDSDDESTASVNDMIDDDAMTAHDERKLAAYHADRERAQDEQQVEKLFHDISHGLLRRKRTTDLDLSDSDSDGEAARRLKRRHFAKMQKALFADERVKKIASVDTQAFLQTMQDDALPIPDTHHATPKPSLQQVRATLSSLLDDAEPAPTADSDSDSAPSDKENQSPVINRLRRREPPPPARLAFSRSSSSAFRVPALLRRATTNSLMSDTGSAASSSGGGFGDDAKIKRGAGKKSGIGGFARHTNESGRAVVEQNEQRRRERKVRGAEKRVDMVGGLLGRGSFE